jgi:hypothetical protein
MKIHTTTTAPPIRRGPVPARGQRRNGRGLLLACGAVTATLLAVVLLAGCGGSSGNGAVAHIDTSKSAGSSPSTSSGSSGLSGYSHAELMTFALKYSVCMRSHGLSDFPDPTLGSNGLPSWNLANRGPSVQDPQSPQYQAADHACKNALPVLAPRTPATKAAANAKALKYVACMRSHGEPDFPDPTGQGLIQITDASGILAPNSPQYETAQQACQSLDSGFEESSSSVHAAK